ncbi:MAG: hypothetical protein QXK49_02050 [Candidatus Aenigmatarchaeota archaeon]
MNNESAIEWLKSHGLPIGKCEFADNKCVMYNSGMLKDNIKAFICESSKGLKYNAPLVTYLKASGEPRMQNISVGLCRLKAEYLKSEGKIPYNEMMAMIKKSNIKPFVKIC